MISDDRLVLKLRLEKEAGINYQKRRHEPWREIYSLYRDIIETNELTQRQAVNIPIMKETKKTLSSRMDDPPDVFFDCLEKGPKAREKEMVISEIWDGDYDKCNFEGVDVLEKNNVLLYGRTFKMLNYSKGKFTVGVPDNLDIVIDPKVNPLDIETAHYIVRLHIYKRLKNILADPKYSAEGKHKLKYHLQFDKEGGGVIQFQDKDQTKEAKELILKDLGIDNFDDMFASDIEVELTEHFTEIWDSTVKKFVRYVVVMADEAAILFKKPLKETIGVEFWPFTSWGEDLDTKDFWTDGMGDIVRIPNKIMNIYFSTMTENRVLASLGMYWYLPAPGFDPSTFTPEAFGMYPAPLIEQDGRYLTVEQVIKKMDIPALEENLVSIDFLVKIVERATAATAIEKGVSEKKQITLGEVEALIEKASKRIVTIAKFYRRSWKEFAWKWRMMREANASGSMKLYKKSYKGSYFEKTIYPKDWISTAGYKERVTTKAEKEMEETKGFEKLMVLRKEFPNDPVIQKIVKDRLLETMELTPDEQKSIKDFENQQKQIQEIPTSTEAGASLETAGLTKSTNELKELAESIK